MTEQKLRYEYEYEYPPQDSDGRVYSYNEDIDEIRHKLEISLENAFENPDPSKLTVEKTRTIEMRNK